MQPTLTRDEWMVIGRALQDRAYVLSSTEGGTIGLRGEEVAECRRLQRIVDDHVDRLRNS